nr:unnamed protein product [Callosobruchus chinensis]
MYSKALLVLLAFAVLVAECQGGPIGAIVAYGACQTACNAGYVACCTAGGATAGKIKFYLCVVMLLLFKHPYAKRLACTQIDRFYTSFSNI